MAERISDAEHAVMEVLWTRAPLTAQDVAEACARDQNWTLATVKTLLARLVSKRAVEAQPEGRRFLYTPLIERQSYVSGETRRMVDRLFGGRLSPLVAQFAEAETLSAEDIAEIEALLQELKQ